MVLISVSSGHKYPKRICFMLQHFSPRNRASKFAIGPRPSRLAEFLGLGTDDVENGILESQVSSLHEFRVINYSVFLRYRCLILISHDFLPLGNHCFYG